MLINIVACAGGCAKYVSDAEKPILGEMPENCSLILIPYETFKESYKQIRKKSEF